MLKIIFLVVFAAVLAATNPEMPEFTTYASNALEKNNPMLSTKAITPNSGFLGNVSQGLSNGIALGTIALATTRRNFYIFSTYTLNMTYLGIPSGNQGVLKYVGIAGIFFQIATAANMKQ